MKSKSVSAWSPAPTMNPNPTRIEISWLEAKAQVIDCHRVSLGNDDHDEKRNLIQASNGDSRGASYVLVPKLSGG
jgi:hypothetical protein